MISDYLEISAGIKDRLLTNRTGKCNGEGCKSLADLGPFELYTCT
jgi:hypothetical protein